MSKRRTETAAQRCVYRATFWIYLSSRLSLSFTQSIVVGSTSCRLVPVRASFTTPVPAPPLPPLYPEPRIVYCHCFLPPLCELLYHSYISAIHPRSPTINFAVVQSETATLHCKEGNIMHHVYSSSREISSLAMYLLLFSLNYMFFMNFFIFVWFYCSIWIPRNITNLLFAYFNYKYETRFLSHVYRELLCY